MRSLRVFTMETTRESVVILELTEVGDLKGLAKDR